MSEADVLRGPPSAREREEDTPVATPAAPDPDDDLDDDQPPPRPAGRAVSPPAPVMPPSMGEQFNLRWNDFHESLARSLCSMRDDEDFVDVTLVCEDGQHVEAHRIVLSACSDYFRRVLRKASVSSSRRLGANPVLVLCGIAFPELQQILRFMYHGEVQVHQEKLQAFLAVAERLQVRGLSNSGDISPSASRRDTTYSLSDSKGNRRRRRESNDADHRAPSPVAGSSGMSDIQHTVFRQRNRSGGEDRHHRPKWAKFGGPDITVKQESLGGAPSPRSPSDHRSAAGSKIHDYGESGGSHDEAELSRSGAGSEADYSDYGPGGAFGTPGEHGGPSHGGFNDHGPHGALMAGMGIAGITPGGMLDPATAKEFWRRAAMARMGLAGSGGAAVGGGGGGTSPFRHLPSPSSLNKSMDSSSGASEQSRRQRSVYSSQQIAQLEAYFAYNEYIDGDRKKQLSLMTSIPEQQIKVWFQNRRQKKKREVEERVQQNMQHPGARPDLPLDKAFGNDHHGRRDTPEDSSPSS